MEIHADEVDDAADELALEIDTSGSATIEVGGTDAITIDSSGNVTFSGTIGGTPSAGTVSNATTVTGTEVYGTVNKTVLVADDLPVVLAEGGTGTNGYGSAAIYAFPEGRIFVLGVTVDSVTVTVDTNALDNADGGDFAFGTAAAGGTSGLSGTEVDLCPSTSIDPITNVVSAALADGAQFDGTSTAKLMYFNHEVDDADIAAACTNTVDFTATVHWINLGDY